MFALLLAQAVLIESRADGSAPLWYVATMIGFGLLVIVTFAIRALSAHRDPVRPRTVHPKLDRPAWRYLHGLDRSRKR